MTNNELRLIIKQEARRIHEELYQEVYSEKQRKWACAQANKPEEQEKDQISKKEAEEMCKGPLKKEISSMGGGNVAGYAASLEKEELTERILNIILSQETE
tara:strand:+ start:119 stop:421 length:303 start_codon:yes stop_codon:yes gene_type:complete